MAAPVLSAWSPNNFSTATDPWSVQTRPGGSSAAGDMMLIFLRATGAAAPVSVISADGSPTFTQIFSESADAADDITGAYYAICTGATTGVVTVEWAAGQKGAAIGWAITGVSNSIAPEASSPTTGTGANIDPASFSPTGGPKDFLYLSCIGWDGETAAASAGPSGYGTLLNANSGTAGGAAGNCMIAAAALGTTASSSENPGAWTQPAPNAGVVAYTIAIHPPAGAAATSLMLPNRNSLITRR